MDPFSILGVSANATDEEIRSAYRRLVKLHHPDSNPEADGQDIRSINWAYETLTDPEKRSRYFQPELTPVDVGDPEEDPVEVYKREFKWRQWQREQREKQEKIAHETDVIRVMRFVNIPIFIFVVLLTVDRMLPAVSRVEKILESTKEFRSGRRTSVEYSFIRTENFKMYFATPMYVYLDSFSKDTIMVTIRLSPIFKVPMSASYFYDNATSTGAVVKTVHARSFIVTSIALFCMVSFVWRQHSSTAYAFCFLPSAFFVLFTWINIID